jgi:hypothetical protein
MRCAHARRVHAYLLNILHSLQHLAFLLNLVMRIDRCMRQVALVGADRMRNDRVELARQSAARQASQS